MWIATEELVVPNRLCHYLTFSVFRVRLWRPLFAGVVAFSFRRIDFIAPERIFCYNFNPAVILLLPVPC